MIKNKLMNCNNKMPKVKSKQYSAYIFQCKRTKYKYFIMHMQSRTIFVNETLTTQYTDETWVAYHDYASRLCCYIFMSVCCAVVYMSCCK